MKKRFIFLFVQINVAAFSTSTSFGSLMSRIRKIYQYWLLLRHCKIRFFIPMKRKVGLIIGYNGEGYHGLQYNGDLHTIEREIIQILLQNSCITEINSKDPQKIDLKSCSRTDKGVHASFNVVNVKIIQEPTEELFNKLKAAFLEHGMMLYKIVRLPKRFVGHKCARSRIYKYVVPTYFLEDGILEDEVAIQQKQDSNKPEEIIIDNKQDSDDVNSESDDMHSQQDMNNESNKTIFRKYENEMITPIKGHKSNKIELFRRMMQCYVGTNNYHNFTTKNVQGDVKRYMKEIQVSEPFYDNEVEYVEVKIHGQSFLLHQIRKMISFAVLNCRYAAEESFRSNFEKALSKEDVHIPKSPSQYLFLSKVFFEDFNERRAETIEADEKEKEVFERSRIYPSILKEENLFEWMKYLDAVRFHHGHFSMFKK